LKPSGENTAWPSTIEEGTNTLVGTTGEKILKACRQFQKGHKKTDRIPDLWDGKTAGRIIEILLA